MPIPDRSELPEKFVAYLDKSNKDFEEYVPEPPIWPSASTPQRLIEAARTLDAEIERHQEDGSEAAGYIDMLFRPLINDVLAEKIAEPVDENWRHEQGLPIVRWGDTDLYEEKRAPLNRAWVDFKVLVEGRDEVTPEKMEGILEVGLSLRKELAKRLGLELELTDEEWWQL